MPVHAGLQHQRAAGDLACPCTGRDDGLPVGIQLVAGYGREDVLIRVAAQLEQPAPGPTATPI